MLRWFAIAVTVFAAAWSAAWFAGRSFMVGEFERQAAALREVGGTVEHGEVEISGFPFSYTGNFDAIDISLPVSEGRALADYQWRAPWLKAYVVAHAPRTIVTEFPPEQELVITRRDDTAGGVFADLPLDIRLFSKALTVTSTSVEDQIHSDTSAERIQIIATLGPPERPAASADINGGALTAQSRIPLDHNAKENVGGGSVDLAGFSALLRLRQPGEAVSQGIAIQASRASGSIDIQSDSERAFTLAFDELGAVLGGTEEVSFVANKAEASGKIAPAASPDKELFNADITLNEVILNAATWNDFDPTGAFERTIPEITLRIDGRMPRHVTLDDLLTGRALLGLDSLNITELRAEALGVDVEIVGSLKTNFGMLAGSLEIEIGGISDFLTQTVRAGLMPPQQALIARLMIQNLGRSGKTPDHTLFEIILKDGVSYVNGTAVGPAPSLP